jgi:hypothetical protein
VIAGCTIVLLRDLGAIVPQSRIDPRDLSAVAHRPNAVASRCAKSGRLWHNVNGAAFAIAFPRFVVADGRAAGAAMDSFIDQIVRRSIRHARLMLKQGSYNWPVVRLALRKILSDLEARAPADPGVRRLRAFIVSKDREWLRENR